jgi:hypothetical protein
MDKILKAYLDNGEEIIGDRSPSEIAYDDAVVDALRQGHSIKESLAIAGTKFPDEALEWNDGNIDEISAHYDYLRNHGDILKMIEAHKEEIG